MSFNSNFPGMCGSPLILHLSKLKQAVLFLGTELPMHSAGRDPLAAVHVFGPLSRKGDVLVDLASVNLVTIFL